MKLLIAFASLLFFLPATAQLDAKGKKELEKRKQKAKENNTVLWMYDTVYRKGEPYCLMQSRAQSEDGNEYMVKGLNGNDIIYVKEPGNIEKALSQLTFKANVEFSFLEEKQKLNVPKKSVNGLPNFIVQNNLVVNNAGNMAAAKKLLFIHSDVNPQGYTSDVEVKADSAAEQKTDKTTKAEEKEETDTAAYVPVKRDTKAKLYIKDYIIRQNGVIIGRYNKTSAADGISETQTRFTIKSPDWKDLVIATNGGFGSTNWDIVFVGSDKKDTLHTSPIHKKALEQIVTYLVNNGYL